MPHSSGPGPMNPFGTLFDDLFTRDAIGCVNAERVDRDGLRKALLDIQKTWDPTTGKVTPTVAPKPREVSNVRSLEVYSLTDT